jgi:hypothetical protein
MKQFFTILLALTTAALNAQTLQIARVSSNGTTTTLYTNLKTAMSDAQDDDFIYMPAGTFNVDSVIIQKRVNIVGTGIYPDSTLATGKTVINGNLYLKTGMDGGSMQGVELNDLNYNSAYGIINVSSSGNFTFSKCMITIITCNSLASGNINIRECVVNKYIGNPNSTLKYNVNNSILADLYSCGYSTFNNCIFSNRNILVSGSYAGGNNEFRNCIFKISNVTLYSGTNDRYFNCHFENVATNGYYNNPIQLNTTYDATNNSTFVGGACPAAFSYTFDYHVKSSSTAAASGTDGTDKGIYGTLYPYNPNPYNPHIYFKSVAPTTNAQGQLQINIKVKAQ